MSEAVQGARQHLWEGSRAVQGVAKVDLSDQFGLHFGLLFSSDCEVDFGQRSVCIRYLS